MSDTTPNLNLPYIAAAQAQKHITHNEAIRALDVLVQLSVQSRSLAAPPVTPFDGAVYIVAAGASGAWLGHDHDVAAFQDGAWRFHAPNTGWRAWVGDEARLVAWSGAAWSDVASGGGTSVNPTPFIGVNTTADATNRLAVKSDATLFSHDDVSPGTGDHRTVLNKAGGANTAAIVFQNAFSGRSEIGLTGNDDFHFKTSPDGTSWSDALVLVAATGTPRFPALTQAGLPSPAAAGSGAVVFVSDATPTPTLAVSDGVAWITLGGATTGGPFNGTFTDELADGAGTPVAITTTIATRQAWQRGRANIVLAGTYDVTGGDPAGMAWRCGSGDWLQFTSETIGAGAWQGTLSIPGTYLAQGTFEVKPINGLNVTPAQVADITISDVFAFAGQSNMGTGTNLQTFTKTNFDWVNKSATGAWSSLTSDPWIGGKGSFAPAMAEALDQAGIPPVTHAITKADGTGFIGNDWNPGDTLYESSFINRLSATIALTGGYAALCLVFGENDSSNGQTTAGWKAAADAMVDDLISRVPELANTPIMWPVLGEHTGVNVDEIRQGVIEFVGEDPRVVHGPNLLGFNYGDNVHYGVVQGALDTAGAEAQLDAIGAHYARAVRQATPAPPALAAIGIGAGADADKVFISFDRAMENHTDTTGFALTDTGGASIASAAQGASTAQVVLQCDQVLYGPVVVSFGEEEDANDATLREAAAVANVKMWPAPFVGQSAGTGAGLAPVLTAAPTLSGTATVGSTLSGADGAYDGVPAPVVGSYQWQRSADGATGWADISGATGATYALQAADETNYVRRGEVATNAVGSAARAYTAASGQVTTGASETVVFDLASDGSLTGISALFGAVLATSQTDDAGGNNAISITDSNAGAAGAHGIRTGAYTYNNGDNIFRVKAKTMSSAGSKMYLMFRGIGVPPTARCRFDITDDATPAGSRVITVDTGWSNASVTDLGNGWWGIEIVGDISGGDQFGQLYMELGDSPSNATLFKDGTNVVHVHEWTGSYV